MTDTADLRRLAEKVLTDEDGDKQLDFQRAANPQAILALLDDYDERGNVLAQLAEDQALAERRVAVLEEGLRALVAAWDSPATDRTVFVDQLIGSFHKARALLAERSIGPDQLADLRQLVNEPGPVCDIPWAAGPANAMCLRCGNRFDEHTQAQPASEAGDER